MARLFFYLYMRILLFSVAQLPLLDYLADYLANTGHEVITLTGKQSHSLPGARRIILNFASGPWKAKEQAEIWKEAIKNGVFGRRALANLAGNWQPDLILARSGQGAAFFIRDVFPGAFIAAFAGDHDASAIALDLDARLFLQSQLAFARGRSQIRLFPQALRKAIRPEPLFVDIAFFESGNREPFRCWKFDTDGLRVVTLVLRGLPGPELANWSRIMAQALSRTPDLGLVVLLENADPARRLLDAMQCLPGNLANRLFITSRLERGSWRNLCLGSAAVIFTSAEQQRLALECVASGRQAFAVKKAGLDRLPGVVALSGREPMQERLLTLEPMPVGQEPLAALKEEHGQGKVIPEFAERILADYHAWTGSRAALQERSYTVATSRDL